MAYNLIKKHQYNSYIIFSQNIVIYIKYSCVCPMTMMLYSQETSEILSSKWGLMVAFLCSFILIKLGDGDCSAKLIVQIPKQLCHHLDSNFRVFGPCEN